MRALRVALALSFFAPAGCLTPPILPPRPDAGLHDAALPPFALVGVEVRDTRGHVWPASAIPRSPSIRVAFTSPPADSSLVLLLTGEADADLAADLDSAPLRASTLARLIRASAHDEDGVVTLTPIEPLAPAASITIALPRWLEDGEGHRLDAAITQTLIVAAGSEAGAEASDAWPPDGAFDVSPALALAAIRFDGAIDDPTHAVVLSQRDAGFVVSRPGVTACEMIGWPEGVCVTLVPAAPLAPDTDYVLGIAPNAHDATGALMPAFEARFHTAAGVVAPLDWMPMMCAIGETMLPSGCTRADDESISFRGQLSGAARLAWTAGASRGVGLTPRGTVSIRIGDLSAMTLVPFAVEARDYAASVTSLTLPITTTEPLATIAITEVRADPFGVEPRQEYVEIENFGASPVSLAGMRLADSPSAMGDLLPTVSIPAGAHALLVAADFDPDDTADVPPPAGTPLVRLDASLASGGLSNSGEPLFLRDAMSRWVSAAPASPPPREGVCIVRASTSHRVGEAGSFRYDPLLTCTPGR
jgi:hypothetical protein